MSSFGLKRWALGPSFGWLLGALSLLAGCAAQEPCAVTAPVPAEARATESAPLVAPTPPIAAPLEKKALSSFQDGKTRSALVEFVVRVTDPTSPEFVPQKARIAVFDNDGTLWSEQPLYVEFAFAIDRVLDLLAKSPAPAWSKKPWAIRLKNDGKKALGELDERALAEIFAAASAGLDEAAYHTVAAEWLAQAKHPRFGRLYTDLTYAPMVELLGYLREHGFSTFIVSGGSSRFIRVFAETAYGISPDQVVGTVLEGKYELRQGRGVVVSQPKLAFLDDGPGKPAGIAQFIGQLPILAVGNSDGDREMLEYVTTQPGPRLGVLVHHDDADREWAYDRTSKIGKLDKALDQAASAKWIVISMKNDFATVYAPPAPDPTTPIPAAPASPTTTVATAKP
jgi:phosphoglycolate phosphatase-like HAD superfamily hydrolase